MEVGRLGGVGRGWYPLPLTPKPSIHVLSKPLPLPGGKGGRGGKGVGKMWGVGGLGGGGREEKRPEGGEDKMSPERVMMDFFFVFF